MKNKLLKIETPKGTVYQYKTQEGKVKCMLEWNPGFGPEWSNTLDNAQAMFDAECLRLTEPYVPMATGMLKNSAQIASNIGGGELMWDTPYAVKQYYSNRKPGSTTGPLRGPRWGERMKADNLPHLESFAKKVIKNGG